MPLRRILSALSAVGVFVVRPDGLASHTPMSLLLRTDTLRSMSHGAKFWTLPGSWDAWRELDVALHGQVPHEAAWGVSRFAYLNDHPAEARAFDRFMANMPDNRHAALAEHYDYSHVRLIADIGGGNGEALRHILTRFGEPRGVVFDVEHVVSAIAPESTLDGRITTVAGSFFESVPKGADLYLLVRVLHDWSDDECIQILRTCRKAMDVGTHLRVGEQLLAPDPTSDAIGYFLDTQMMAMFGRAHERSENEFESLLSTTGFTLERVIATGTPVSIIEAISA